jgi:hypothetical protein
MMLPCQKRSLRRRATPLEDCGGGPPTAQGPGDDVRECGEYRDPVSRRSLLRWLGLVSMTCPSLLDLNV